MVRVHQDSFSLQSIGRRVPARLPPPRSRHAPARLRRREDTEPQRDCRRREDVTPQRDCCRREVVTPQRDCCRREVATPQRDCCCREDTESQRDCCRREAFGVRWLCHRFGCAQLCCAQWELFLTRSRAARIQSGGRATALQTLRGGGSRAGA